MNRSCILVFTLVIIIMNGISCARSKMPEAEKALPEYPEAISSGLVHDFAMKLSTVSGHEGDSVMAAFIEKNPVSPVIESDSVFSLYWIGKAGQVQVNGDLQKGWSEAASMHKVSLAEDLFFYISYKVPPGSRLDYILTIDMVSVTDPRNPSVTPSGYGAHSEVAMPGFIPDPIRSYRADIPHGSIDSLNFSSSDASISARQLKIYLPPGYQSILLLPVIYVTDGLEALEFMSYQVVLDNMIADQRMTPAIVVFIPPGERHNEKTGEKTDAFKKVICDEMVPLIDRNYNTDPRPEKRAITGISSGGHFALLTLFSRNDVFRNGVGQSPTLSDRVIDAMRSMVKSGKYDASMKIYFDAGLFDLPHGTLDDMSFLEAARSFHAELDSHKISHVYQEFDDGHAWANWRERTDDILGYFFPVN